MATLRRLLALALSIALLAPCAVASRAVSVAKDSDSASSFKVVPKAYIVELEPRVANLDGRSEENLHSRFHRRAQEEKLEYKIRREFVDDSLFHGLSIDVQSAEDVATIENLSEVKRVWPVIELPLPVPFDRPDSTGSITKRAPALPPKGPPKVIRSENSTMDFNLKATGVDQLHSHGFKGKDIKVAVIDSGVDYNHPALGGGFGPGKKVAFGRNYVESEGTPDDPIATCEQASHGTSTAGIIIAEDPKGVGFGLKGVAPEATLGMYRVGSCSRGPESDTVLKALIDAYNDGADVVSVSIGWASGFDGFATHDQVITNGKKRGIATIVAAGNDGAQNGPITMNMPAISKGAIAVACSDTVKFPTTYKVRGSTGEEYRYSSLWPLEGNFHVYAAEDYDDSIGCDWGMSFAAIDEMKKRGWKLFETVYMARKSDRCAVGKITTIMYNSGVAGVIWWQDEEAVNPSDNNYPKANSMGMDYIDGPQLYKAVLKDPLNFRLSFTDKRFVSVDNPSAGLTSNYSAYGSTWEYNSFKPLLSAPGHLTLTTYPMEGGGYDVASGTSIATPFVAGCYAIMKQAFPKLSVQEITDLLTTTATPAKWWGDDEIVHTVSQQGAGTLNVWRAYNSGLKFLQGTLLVGQASEPTLKNITFTNTMSRIETFEISHVPAGLVQRVPYADLEFIKNAKFGFPSKPVYADVEFKTSTKVTLGPGESETVEFVVTPPEGIDPDTIPQYSGYIRFTSSSQDVYNVAYQGMPYDLKNTPILERDILPEYPQLPSLYGPSEDGDEYDYFRGDMISVNKTNDESISIHYFRRQPVYAYRIDVVAANTTFEPTYFDFNASHTLNTSTPEVRIYDSLGGVDSLGYLEMQTQSVPRLDEVSWYGDLYYGEDDDGTVDSGFAPEGDYRILIRVLRVEGDVKKAEDWESWLSPVVRLSGSVPDDDDDEEDDGDNEGDDDENDDAGDEDNDDNGNGHGGDNDNSGDEDADEDDDGDGNGSGNGNENGDGNGGHDGNGNNNGNPGHGGDDGSHDEYPTSSSSPSSPTSACP